MKAREDIVGGLLLVIGAGFYCLNIYDTYIAQDTVGVSITWATFFVLINIYYIRIFVSKELYYSATGSTILAIAESVWLIQICYYSR